MKQIVQGLLRAQLKVFDELIKDLESILMCKQKFSFYCEKAFFCTAGNEIVPNVKYFKKFSSEFNKQGIKKSLLQLLFYLRKKT